MRSQANRGQAFEEIIGWCNIHYRQKKKAFVIKVPIPIKVLKLLHGIITKGFYEEPAFVDYIGLVKGKGIAFDAKETEETDFFPLKNIKPHQYEYMKEFTEHGGQAFLLVHFAKHHKVYRLDFCYIDFYWKQHKENKGKRGFAHIPLKEFELNGHLCKWGQQMPLDYLEGLY